jgi:hypothetical protein
MSRGPQRLSKPVGLPSMTIATTFRKGRTVRERFEQNGIQPHTAFHRHELELRKALQQAAINDVGDYLGVVYEQRRRAQGELLIIGLTGRQRLAVARRYPFTSDNVVLRTWLNRGAPCRNSSGVIGSIGVAARCPNELGSQGHHGGAVAACCTTQKATTT